MGSNCLPGWPAVPDAIGGAEVEAEAVRGVLALARSMATVGRRVDLAGLDRLVGRLCARSLDLPPGDGRRMSLLLAGLLVEIDLLNAEMAKTQR